MDAMKTQLQSAKSSKSIRNVVQTIFREHGVRGFYRGLTAPMFLYGMCSSIWFGVNFNAEKWFFERRGIQTTGNSHAQEHILPIHEGMFCGALAGFAGNFVLAPMERLKIYTQTHKSTSGGLHTLKHLVRTEGFSGLLRGFWGSALRETMQVAFYFPVYSFTRAGLIQMTGASPDAWWLPLVAGAHTGNMIWVVSMPVDMMKTRVQSGQCPNFAAAYKSVLKEGGIRAFWRGTLMACMRATPLHATIHFTYDNFYSFLDRTFS